MSNFRCNEPSSVLPRRHVFGWRPRIFGFSVLVLAAVVTDAGPEHGFAFGASRETVKAEILQEETSVDPVFAESLQLEIFGYSNKRSQKREPRSLLVAPSAVPPFLAPATASGQSTSYPEAEGEIASEAKESHVVISSAYRLGSRPQSSASRPSVGAPLGAIMAPKGATSREVTFALYGSPGRIEAEGSIVQGQPQLYSVQSSASRQVAVTLSSSRSASAEVLRSSENTSATTSPDTTRGAIPESELNDADGAVTTISLSSKNSRHSTSMGISAATVLVATPEPSPEPSSSTVLNVRDFGAIGDGETDDTVALQQALWDARPGQTVLFPPGTYKTSSTLFLNTSHVLISGYGAVITNRTNSRGVLAIHGGGSKLASDVDLDNLLTTPSWGAEIENVRISGLTGVMLDKAGGGRNLGFIMSSAKNCTFEDVSVSSSNGNAFQLSHCIGSTIQRCEATGHRDYGVFIFQSRECNVSESRITGGQRGIVFKHNREGRADCGHVADRNTLTDIESSQYWIIGGTWIENELDAPIYGDGHEVVGNVTITNNTFQTIRGMYAPGITVGTFAKNWQIHNNTFSGNSQPGSALSMGVIGNYQAGGSVGGSHIVDNNIFKGYNCPGSALISTKTDAKITNNKIYGDTLYILYANNGPSSQISSIEFSDNEVVTGLYLRYANENGICIGGGVKDFLMMRNDVTTRSIKNGTLPAICPLYSAAEASTISSNRLSIEKGEGVTTPLAYGVFLAGQGGTFSRNTVLIDSDSSIYGVYINKPGYSISHNRLEAREGTSATNRHGIYTYETAADVFFNELLRLDMSTN